MAEGGEPEFICNYCGADREEFGNPEHGVTDREYKRKCWCIEPLIWVRKNAMSCGGLLSNSNFDHCFEHCNLSNEQYRRCNHCNFSSRYIDVNMNGDDILCVCAAALELEVILPKGPCIRKVFTIDGYPDRCYCDWVNTVDLLRAAVKVDHFKTPGNSVGECTLNCESRWGYHAYKRCICDIVVIVAPDQANRPITRLMQCTSEQVKVQIGEQLQRIQSETFGYFVYTKDGLKFHSEEMPEQDQMSLIEYVVPAQMEMYQKYRLVDFSVYLRQKLLSPLAQDSYTIPDTALWFRGLGNQMQGSVCKRCKIPCAVCMCMLPR
jgi:hypothetical protein